MIKRVNHTKSVDWYLLGVMLYEMLVGIPPYYSTSKEELFDNIKNAPLTFPDDISENARSLIEALMNRDLKKRLGAKNDG